ncbi:hypothetical protein QBC36DRAFT_335439 [Triangularia setosa]|uniref:F-box domain-containing protein n=1 Tax=Triangularia setosa TaxID=2587417 RepID=A0AAN6W3G0_9PEZI|nr:hypothetical protein QBC36DRAFT_335439 [Podospora setosa]
MVATTSITHLPPEIWLMIIDILIPTFFQENVRRLTICKKWYSLVIFNFYSKMEYTPRIISCLVHNKASVMDKTRLHLHESLHSMTIVPKRPISKLENCKHDQDLIYDTPANLAKLYHELSRFERLKSIRFVANHRSSWVAWHCRKHGFLPLKSLKSLITGLCSSTFSHGISVEPWSSITSLEFDLDGAAIEWGGWGDTKHLCPILRPLMARLHTLKIRTQSICPGVLGPLEKGEVYSVTNLRINLHFPVSTVNPKLNCAGMCPNVGSGKHSTPTSRPHLYAWPTDNSWYNGTLESMMRRAMKRLASILPADRKVELVHLAPNTEVHVWNALTDECVRDETVEKIDLGQWLSGEGECFLREEDYLEEDLEKASRWSEEEDMYDEYEWQRQMELYGNDEGSND